MRRQFGALVGAAGLMVATAALLAAGNKPSPTPTGWLCRVTFRDAVGDMIRSDGHGAYENGTDGVACTIMSDPTVVHYGWLNLTFTSDSPRYLLYPGQTSDINGGPGYNTLFSHGSFELKGLAKLIVYDPYNPAYFDVVPFRANQDKGWIGRGQAQVYGDSNFTSGSADGESSPFVQAIDGCSWNVWLDPTADLIHTSLGEISTTQTNPRVLSIRNGVGYSNLYGLYVLPFAATVRVIGGGPATGNRFAGCTK